MADCQQEFLLDIAQKNQQEPSEALFQVFKEKQTMRDCIEQFTSHYPGVDYLYVEFPDQSKAIYALTGNIKLTANVGRSACRHLLNLPEERDDWRKCEEGREKESKIVAQFKKQFSPFDFTI